MSIPEFKLKKIDLQKTIASLQEKSDKIKAGDAAAGESGTDTTKEEIDKAMALLKETEDAMKRSEEPMKMNLEQI
ncbi:hypothetical protein Dda_1184 [Drechslerella dactyloides]|uniref:Uncharacterized protein n=1 Tax=Drechslerella dactyloides TaxID=74499 RepID=A0AAD6NN83_DREDA|nr:hypothetical protein Dda_1184 [Drechslerella dactyloides]